MCVRNIVSVKKQINVSDIEFADLFNANVSVDSSLANLLSYLICTWISV